VDRTPAQVVALLQRHLDAIDATNAREAAWHEAIAVEAALEEDSIAPLLFGHIHP
jgi:hypothetical protein